jgi:pimeloyl-ACP methyl ester carboxylesterase
VTLDHRGVGKSDRLGCSEQESAVSEGGATVTDTEWPQCIRAIEDHRGASLATFTTTAAARDVGALIERMRRPGEQTFVWGGSYGSYLALRYMQLFADQPDGVVLEGIAPPGTGFHRYSANMNEVGQAVFARCAEDAACRAHLGDDPWASVGQLLASLDAGHCPALKTSSDTMRGFLGSLLMYEQIRGVVAPLVYRTKRCSPGDLTALANFVKVLGSASTANVAGAAPPFGFGMGDDSRALFYQIAFAEFWNGSAPTAEAAAAELPTLRTATAVTLDMARRAKEWPKTPPDAYHGKLPSYGKPILMLQGGLDPATHAKYTNILKEHFNGERQTYVLFDAAAHDPANGTRTTSGQSCALSLYAAFLADPARPLDMSCIADVEGVTFLARPGEAKAFFGTDDAWD